MENFSTPFYIVESFGGKSGKVENCDKNYIYQCFTYSNCLGNQFKLVENDYSQQKGRKTAVETGLLMISVPGCAALRHLSADK
ncbi:hypothetical protein [Pantoea agglomerans]